MVSGDNFIIHGNEGFSLA